MSKQGRKANAEANAEVVLPMSSLTHTQVIITFRDLPCSIIKKMDHESQSFLHPSKQALTGKFL